MRHRAKSQSTTRKGLAVPALLSLFAGVLLSTGLGLPGTVAPAMAQSSCQIDFELLTKKRMSYIEALNKDAKRRKGKLDPSTACPRLRGLAGAEGAMLAYMKKNQKWCGIPEEPIKQMEDTRAKTASLAGQACKAAAQISRMQSQARRNAQNQGGGAPARPKLPSGPL